jgi:hypothetical protein
MGLFVFFMFTIPVLADSTVVGTGDPATDVPAVQAAVDAGGTVTLVGTFNFGYDPSGYWYNKAKFRANDPYVPEEVRSLPFHKGESTVYISTSVTIKGLGATIIGGRPTFKIGWDGEILAYPPESGPPQWNGDWGTDWIPLAWGDEYYDSNVFANPEYAGLGIYRYYRAYRDIDVTIDGITSQNAHNHFIVGSAGHSLAYTNNEVYDVMGEDVSVWPFGSGIGPRNTAMNATGGLYAPHFLVQNYKTYIDLISNFDWLTSITGNVVIKDNYIVNSVTPGVGGNISAAFQNAVNTIEGNTIIGPDEGLHICDIPNGATIKNNTIIGATKRGMNIFRQFKEPTVSVLDNTIEVSVSDINADKPAVLRLYRHLDSIIKGNKLGSNGEVPAPLIRLERCTYLILEANTSLPGSTSDYGILLSDKSGINTFSNINLNNLTVAGKFVYCESGTSGNTGMNILVPTCSEYAWIRDDGIDNDFTFTEVSSYPNSISNLIALIKKYNLQQGIKNSLIKKLVNSLASLNAANADQRKDAVNKLNEFINECQNQSGKMLEPDQATQLIEAASCIIAGLGSH